jgi:predicted nucleotidyltransferase component of viral defense system
MITLGRITQQADADGVDADTVERDYVLTHVMASLSHHPDSDMFQFKGGTLLRLCYFNEYRYSADIDLNLDPDTDVNSAVGVLGEILDATALKLPAAFVRRRSARLHVTRSDATKGPVA